MTTFDKILPAAAEVLTAKAVLVAQLDWLVINRDLNGRVRFIVPEKIESNLELKAQVEALYQALAERIATHTYPVATGILFEANVDDACAGGTWFPLEGFDKVWVVDRLATEGNWAQIAPETQGAPRVVFSRSRAASVARRRLRLARGNWLSSASACWCLISTWSRQDCLPVCCRSSDSPCMALPTGWWKIWSTRATPSSTP